MRKLYKCNANIYFNKQYLKRHITLRCAKIRIPNTSPAHRHTQNKIPTIRIRDEIKYLYAEEKIRESIRGRKKPTITAPYSTHAPTRKKMKEHN